MAENFLSFEALDLSFKNSFVIEGINLDEGGSNGSGKSAIIEAIVFGLYGESLRKVLLEDLVRQGTERMKVELHFDNGVLKRIFSKKEGSNALLMLNGKKIVGVKQVNKFIEEKFGSFYDFMLTTCFTDRYRFSKLTETERKKLIERFVNLEKVDMLLEKVKQKEKEIEKSLNEVNVRIELNASLIEKAKKDLLRIDEELKQIDTLTLPEIDLESYNKLQLLKQEKKRLESDILSFEKDLKRLREAEKNVEKGICPVCLRPLDGKVSFVKAQIQKEIETLLKNYNALKEKLKSVCKEIEELKHLENVDIKGYLKKLELKGKRDELIHQKGLLKENIQKYQNILKEYLEKKNEWEKLYDVATFWKKQLGYKGVKNLLLQSFFYSFESLINEYLEFFNFPFSVEFFYDEEHLQVYLYNRQGKRLLETFSQGEKRKFDIAVIFALRSFLRSAETLGWLFFDEVFDGLDMASIQKILDAFEGLAENYVIVSHLQFPFPFPKVKVQKLNGKSSILVEAIDKNIVEC